MSMSAEKALLIDDTISHMYDKLIDDALDWCVITPQDICYWEESESGSILRAKESIGSVFIAIWSRLNIVAYLGEGKFKYKDNLFSIDMKRNKKSESESKCNLLGIEIKPIGCESITIKVLEN